MTGEELIAYTRKDVLHDRATPYLWSDELILQYLVEAENWFARLTYALLDDSSNLTTVTLQAGVAEYLVSKKVLHVFGALVQGQSRDLTNYTRRFMPNQLLTTTGTPQIFALDEAKNTIRVYPVPNEAGTLHLRIARLPLNNLTENTSPEIPEQYHTDLPEFVAMRCFSNAEVDGGNLGSAKTFEASWKARIGEAKREYYRFRTGANTLAQNNWTGKRN